MPSNGMIACPSCRTGRKGRLPGTCLKCGTEELYFGAKVTLPKKKNVRAWKRIAKGEGLWDRRKVRRGIPGRYRGPKVDLGG